MSNDLVIEYNVKLGIKCELKKLEVHNDI